MQSSYGPPGFASTLRYVNNITQWLLTDVIWMLPHPEQTQRQSLGYSMVAIRCTGRVLCNAG